MSSRDGVTALHRLAAMCGVDRSYRDVDDRVHVASTEALLATLRSLGTPVRSPDDAAEALVGVEAARARRLIEPVLVRWEGRASPCHLRLPERQAEDVARTVLQFEQPERKNEERVIRLADLPVVARQSVDGKSFVTKRIEAFGDLPLGRHRLTVSVGPLQGESRVIAAPRIAAASGSREWGVFLPLYALRTHRDWGTGDFTDLGRLVDWAGSVGCRLVGTLPLLATFVEDGEAYSPYAPASRLFWNELLVDPTATPEAETSPEVRRWVASEAFQRKTKELQEDPWVDWSAQARLREPLMRQLSRVVTEGDSARGASFRRFLREEPGVVDYARFRAVRRFRREPWQEWPERMRRGDLRPEDGDPEEEMRHAYAQWIAREQLEEVARRDAALYLDLPLGVHPSGYDVYRNPDLFVSGVAAGSPPDPFFRKGQNWGFPPVHPQFAREDGYEHWSAVLRHHFQYAPVLRIDHVMSLNRLFFVPEGLSARDGVYVRYNAEEWYAVLCLEAMRAGAVVVGEDLGTVPPEVRDSMRRHRVKGMHVLQFELDADRPGDLPEPRHHSLVALNTHDMPTFAGFCEAKDVADRVDLGFLDADGATEEQRNRRVVMEGLSRTLRREGWLRDDASLDSLMEGILTRMAAGPAETLLVNLEDLWLERRPQNVPGTSTERPNWCRRAGRSLEALRQDGRIANLLRRIDRLRRHEAEEGS